MEYKVKGAKLQDVVTKTEQFIAFAGDLGSISSDNLVVPQEQFHPSAAVADFVWAYNLTDGEALTVTLSDGEFTFDGSTALTADTVVQIVIKLPS